MAEGIASSPEDRRLLALVAVFAPARAEPLLSRLGLPGAERLRAEGIRLSSARRQARLFALADALAPSDALDSEVAEALVAAERPRTVAALRAGWRVGTRRPRDRAIRPPLRRLLDERLRPTLD